MLGVGGEAERIHGEKPVDTAHARGKQAARQLAAVVALDGLPVGPCPLRPAEVGIGCGNEGRSVAERLRCRGHRRDGFVVIARREQRDARERRVPFRVMWRQAQGVSTRLHRELVLAQPCQGRGSVSEHVGIVRVQVQRAHQLPAGRLVVPAIELGHAEDAVGAMVAIVELDGATGEVQYLLTREEPMVPGEARPLAQMGHGEADIGAREP